MKQYYETYDDFSEPLREVTGAFLDSNPWRGTDAEKMAKFTKWLRTASEIYDVPEPTLIVRPMEAAIRGFYQNHLQLIVLYTFSATVLFHEFRHHLQFCGKAGVDINDVHMIEHDVRAWSHSLYYQVRPKRFLKAFKEGKVGFIVRNTPEPPKESPKDAAQIARFIGGLVPRPRRAA